MIHFFKSHSPNRSPSTIFWEGGGLYYLPHPLLPQFIKISFFAQERRWGNRVRENCKEGKRVKMYIKIMNHGRN
jgi:hypothetical protein